MTTTNLFSSGSARHRHSEYAFHKPSRRARYLRQVGFPDRTLCDGKVNKDPTVALRKDQALVCSGPVSIMSPAAPPSPAVRCPHCEAVRIIKKEQTLTRIFYFCLACEKRFERTEKWKGGSV
jgi:DNA-directed RNA polymerase subunit RPC12/RpoP